MNKTVLDALKEDREAVKKNCEENGVKYDYEISIHGNYYVLKETDLDRGGHEFSLYGSEKTKHKGFVATFPTGAMALQMAHYCTLDD